MTYKRNAYLSEAELYNDFDIPPLKQDLESITNGNGIILIGMIDEHIIGSVRGNSFQGTCFIGKLIVKNGFQNKGIGQLLMNSIERKFGYFNRYELFTGFKSLKNLYLYSKLGYKEFKLIKRLE